jgi:hypothetical protein
LFNHASSVLHGEHGESKNFALCGHPMREVGDRKLVPTCSCYRFEWSRNAGVGLVGVLGGRIVRNVGGVPPGAADGVILDRDVSGCLGNAVNQWRSAAGESRRAPFLSRSAQADAARRAR